MNILLQSLYKNPCICGTWFVYHVIMCTLLARKTWEINFVMTFT